MNMERRCERQEQGNAGFSIRILASEARTR